MVKLARPSVDRDALTSEYNSDTISAIIGMTEVPKSVAYITMTTYNRRPWTDRLE